MTSAMFILIFLKVCLAAAASYLLKESFEAMILRRQTVKFDSLQEAEKEHEDLLTRLDRIETAALIGFTDGVCFIYAKLFINGSHDFSYAVLLFPLIGLQLSGKLKPLIALPFEQRLRDVEKEIHRLTRSNVMVSGAGDKDASERSELRREVEKEAEYEIIH